MSRAEQAAKKFFNKIEPGLSWDYTNHPTKHLVLSAFELYASAWKSQRWDVRSWEWPFREIESNKPFEDGDQPWTVLLRRVLELVRERKSIV